MRSLETRTTPPGRVAQRTDPGDRPCYPASPDSPRAGRVGSVAAVPDTPSDRPLPPFLRACRGIPGGPDDRVPVWFMRQAGRSLPEYRAIRGEGSILDAIHDPELVGRDHPAAGAPLRRRRRHPLQRHRRAGGRHRLRRRRRPGRRAGRRAAVPSGPRTSTASARSTPRPTRPTCSRRCAILVERAGDVPLIGFAGAPFTVASYLVEGRPSRTYAQTKALMLGDPDLWHQLLDRLADLAIASLRSQVDAGARPSSSSTPGPARCAPPDYERFVLPAQPPGVRRRRRPRRAPHPLRRRHRRAARR